MSASAHSPVVQPPPRSVRLFLCGDVMTGRGIDQVLSYPCDPVLHEGYVQSATEYVELAEAANGPIPRAVGPAYVWGAALDELKRMQPDVRIINLETSITRSEDYARKGINYRMSPDNADCLKAANIDCCVLGNNHILDWGSRGLLDTLATLEHLQIKTAGAGRDLDQAGVPAVLDIAGNRRVLVFSFGSATSGIPHRWAAASEIPGVNLLSEISETGALRVVDEIARMCRPDDLTVVSVHWGPNWGYGIPDAQRRFAHAERHAAWLLLHSDLNRDMRREAAVEITMITKVHNPVDKYVGSRVRMRRLTLGMSQEALANQLGLTFQQVQEYEKGRNRISASRLQQMCHILQVPVPFFFDGAPQIAGYSAKGAKAPSPAYVSDFLANPTD